MAAELMQPSLRYVDTLCQRSVDRRSSVGLRWAMAHAEEERKALGSRLASARKLAGFTIQQAADELTARGYPIKKQAVGAWEVGRNVPDALWMRRLAKLYATTVDALLWDDTLSMDAIQVAAQYDSLSEREKNRLRILWDAMIRSAADDETVERRMPITATPPSLPKLPAPNPEPD